MFFVYVLLWSMEHLALLYCISYSSLFSIILYGATVLYPYFNEKCRIGAAPPPLNIDLLNTLFMIILRLLFSFIEK
jgi:hypothetical protein